MRTISDGLKDEPAFILLRRPGVAGAYMEQVEHRSGEAIEALRASQGMSTIYDNGGSFVLYYAGSAAEISAFARWR